MHRKKRLLWLHLSGDLCIIIRRPPPRWAKWSRGVRTRGLRVGLVGGPRPLFFLGPGFSYRMKHAGPLTSAGRLTLTFKRSGLIYGTDDEPPGFRLKDKGSSKRP